MMLFTTPIWDLLPQMKTAYITIDIDDAQYEALKACQNKYKDNDTLKKILPFLQNLQWWSSRKTGAWTHGFIVEPTGINH